MKAWEAVQAGQRNPLREMILNDAEFSGYLPTEEIAKLLQIDQYLGIAPQRAKELAHRIKQSFKEK